MFTMELQGHVPEQEFGKFSFKISDLTLFGYHCHSMYLLFCSFYNKYFKIAVM